MNDSYEAKLNAHYAHANFGEAILDWLRTQGKDLDALTVEDLAPADQYHGGGQSSTANLAQMAGITGEMRVADLGGGLGGPARQLVTACGCSVDVVDLAADLCAGGEVLTRQMRLGDKVHFFNESATKTSLPSGAYDIVWMQNAAMNIEDRAALYAEIGRLLKPAGRYVFQEVFAGDKQPAYYPGNFATDASESFIYTPESVLRWLLDAQFRVLVWQEDMQASGGAADALRVARLQAASASTAPLPHYMSTEMLRQATENGRLNTSEGRTRSGRGLLQKL